MELDYAWLEENVLTSKLNNEDKALLKGILEISEYKSGDTIVKQGQAGGVLYIVHSGSAEVTCHFNNTDVRVATAKHGSLFGEMTFLTDENTSATVTAKEDCVIYKLRREDYSEMMRKNQDLVYGFFVNILIHTSEVIRHMNVDHAAMQQYIMGRKG